MKRISCALGPSRRARRIVAITSITAVVVASGLLVRPLSALAGITVDFNDVHQRIDGFGAADVFLGALTDAQADLFFSPTNGIGLSILRTGIGSDGSSMGTYSNATKAAARGAIVWAAPWTAPAAWKDNGSEVNGGHLLPADYDAWATRLVGFANTFSQNTGGVPLYGLSVQNEPDFQASYISMLYTNQEMANFVKVLGPKLAALNPRPKLLMPDLSSWGGAWGFSSAVLGDSVAAPYLDIIAVHQYAGVSAPQTTAKPIWETEQSSFEGFDPSIGNGLMVARWIHDAITIGNVSAWHYWWLMGINADDEGLIGFSHGTQITKRLYTMGNFSKFVRPGFMVVGTTGAPAGVSVTAYKHPTSGAIVIVAINQNGSDMPVNVALNGVSTTAVTPWVTSSAFDLAPQAAIPVSGGSFSATLLASSVTSFVANTSSLIADTTPPSTPVGVTAGAVSSSQVNLSWTASTDDVAVTGYRIYRGGNQIGTATTTGYSDSGLTPSTTYSYTVAAFDAAGNTSSQSATASASTQTDTTTQSTSVPTLMSLSSTSGPVGMSVTINGANFGATQGTGRVRFNTSAATPSSWSASRIIVPVPSGSASGNVTVTINGVTSNGIAFTVTKKRGHSGAD